MVRLDAYGYATKKKDTRCFFEVKYLCTMVKTWITDPAFLPAMKPQVYSCSQCWHTSVAHFHERTPQSLHQLSGTPLLGREGHRLCWHRSLRRGRF